MVTKVFRDTHEQATAHWVWSPYSGGSQHSYAQYTERSEYEMLGRSDVPNFKKRMLAGELLPLNAYLNVADYRHYLSGSYQGSQSGSSGGTGHYVEGKPPLDFNSYCVGHAAALSLIREDDLRFAVQKAAAKFYTQGWDALTSLAELKETIGLFRGLVPRFIKLVKETKRRNYGAVLSNVDLEVRYGWRTLYYELQEIAELLSNDDVKERFRAISQVPIQTIQTDTSKLAWQLGTWHFTSELRLEGDARGLVMGEDVPPPVTINPVLTAWEVVRLSFVVDWFFAVGQSLAAVQYVTFHPKHVSACGLKVNLIVDVRGNVVSNPGYSASGSAHFMQTLRFKQRIPMAIPEGPIAKVRLDGWKIVDLLSLAFQALRSRRKD